MGAASAAKARAAVSRRKAMGANRNGQSGHMTRAISSGRAGGISSVRLGGPGGKGGAASAAMSGIAASVASSIAAELNLTVDPDRQRKPFAPAHDLYEIEDVADTVTSALGGGPADRGRMAQALNLFAQEVASLVAARPESRSLELVQRAIQAAQSGDAADISAALRAIDRTTHAIAGKPQGVPS